MPQLLQQIDAKSPNGPIDVEGVGEISPAVVLEVFSPVREDYAELFNKYVRED